MDLKSLSQILKRAEGLFRSSGATAQAEAVGSIGAKLSELLNEPMEDLVGRAKARLLEPSLLELDPAEIAQCLVALRSDEAAFETIVGQLKRKDVSKQKVVAVAAAYTGVSKPSWSSKPAALKAMRSFFEQKAYLAAKAAMEEKVTPF